MTIDESLDAADVLDKQGYAYLIHPLTDGVPRIDPALLREWVKWAAAQEVLKSATLLVAPEAMAIPLATAVSVELDIPLVVARKRKYGLPGEAIAYCETGYGKHCLYLNDIRPADKVVVIDDVLSTGGTLRGLLGGLQSIGCAILGTLVFLDKGDAASHIAEAHGVPIHTMRKVRVTLRGVEPA